jgi:hypothetical protein
MNKRHNRTGLAAAPTDDTKSFTSWKLDLQKYLLADPRLKPACKLVAICILHHVNVRTRQAFVSAETISDKTCVCLRDIGRARKQLKETGWLDWFHTRTANTYTFSDKNLNVMRDHEVLQKDARDTRRKQKLPSYRRTQESKSKRCRVTQESNLTWTQESDIHLTSTP